MSQHKLIAVLLLLSALTLGVMVPGGPIETRHFSQIALWILGTFNVFLTALGILSLIATFMFFTKKWSSFALAAFLGSSYFMVYALDLLRIFPVSSDAMPMALRNLEIFGAVLAIMLTAISIRSARITRGHSLSTVLSPRFTGNTAFVVAGLIALGIGIVVFATISAMGK